MMNRKKNLKILLVGSGGREYALAWKLSQSETVDLVYFAPGNGGCLNNLKIVDVPELSDNNDFDKLTNFSILKRIDLVVPGPEIPLVNGIKEAFMKIGIPVFGPSSMAALMEGSKIFSKNFMINHNIPTAKFEVFTNIKDAESYISTKKGKYVIKADGLAGGKGVLIPENKDDALVCLKKLFIDKIFGKAGEKIIIEDFLEGNEMSILTITDGYSFYNLPPAQDHKKIFDGDKGLNTGGMGAFSPSPFATSEVMNKINEEIIQPTISGMRKDGFPMCGVLFTGIVLDFQSNPKVLEYNVRFGDPETQAILPLLTDDTDFAQILLSCVENRLDSVEVKIKPNTYSTAVVMSAKGYPNEFLKGHEIKISEKSCNDILIFHAGTKIQENKLVTSGGRVIILTGLGRTLKESVETAYKGVELVSYEGKYYRTDIGHKGIKLETLKKLTYLSSGVSVENGNELVKNISKIVKSTRRKGCDSKIGGFGGLFFLNESELDLKDLVLVSTTDGVGTKLLIAQELDIHNTVGIDLVAMNVNDLIVQGAEPLFFLDYFASGKLDLDVAQSFISGVAEGCLQSECALVGGETSEMPGMYSSNKYDVNGTSVGAVLRSQLLPKTNDMKPGDLIIGLTSNGFHSNGYSLIRKIVKDLDYNYYSIAPWSSTGMTFGETLLTPTKIYVKKVLGLMRKNLILGAAHITGGGLIENIPRILRNDLQAEIDLNSWVVPDIFKWFIKAGNVPINDAFKTFNMGIGFVLIVLPENSAEVLSELKSLDEPSIVIGTLKPKSGFLNQCILVNTPDYF